MLLLINRDAIHTQLPGGKGLWPGFWMLPSDDRYGPWAAGGEIDVMVSYAMLPAVLITSLACCKRQCW
jgi:hypothetical protein